MDISLQPLLDLNPLIGSLITLCVGGCIGSFLNVVIYRMPAGESLSFPGSRCPACGHAIRGRHNIPVLGWLWLRGRCHDCQASINARYPIVEATVAVVFVTLWWVDVQWYDVRSYDVQTMLPAVTTDQRVLTYLLHVTLVCTLLVIGLIEWDRSGLPRRIILPAAILLLATLLWKPSLLLLLHADVITGVASILTEQ